jgi:probable rRNA maturation factor
MITIKNTQRKITVNTQKVKKDIEHLLALLSYPDFDIGLWITTNKTVRSFNKQYRQKDKATDILSFPYYTDLKAGQKIKAVDPEDKNLGDLIISAPYVAKEATRLNIPFQEHMRNLIIHGICHLLGYDHIHDQDYRRMRLKESFLLKQLLINAQKDGP